MNLVNEIHTDIQKTKNKTNEKQDTLQKNVNIMSTYQVGEHSYTAVNLDNP